MYLGFVVLDCKINIFFYLLITTFYISPNCYPPSPPAADKVDESGFVLRDTS